MGVLLGGAAGWAAAARVNAPLAKAYPHAAVTAATVVPGGPPALPWPSKGQGAVVVPSIGIIAEIPPDAVNVGMAKGRWQKLIN